MTSGTSNEQRARTYLPLQRMEPLIAQVAVGGLQREQDNAGQSPACSISEHFTGQHEVPHQAEPLMCKTKPEAVTWWSHLK